MSPQDLLNIVSQHLARMKQPAAKPASPADISSLAAALGHPLPHQLAQWLTLCRGGYLEAHSVTNLLTPQQMLRDREDVINDYNKPRSWLPIADDGCGDFYCLICPPDPRAIAPVVFLDHEDGTTYLCGSSFFKFLEITLVHEPRDAGEDSPIFDERMFFAIDPDAANIRQYGYGWD